MSVWMEPWADQFNLEPQDSMELVFVGPPGGAVEVDSGPLGLSIHGWEGSEGFAFRQGVFAGRMPTIGDIVQQEMEVAEYEAESEIVMRWLGTASDIQMALDSLPRLDRESQSQACKLAAILCEEIATSLPISPAATDLLYRIADRIVGTKGLVLCLPARDSKASHFRTSTPDLRRIAISVLPWDVDAPLTDQRKGKRPCGPSFTPPSPIAEESAGGSE